MAPSSPLPTAGNHGPPVDWRLAARVAARLMPAGPDVSPRHARRVVELLRSDAVRAESHVRDLTGLGAGVPLLPADVVDRPTWAAATTQGMSAALAGVPLSDIPSVARVGIAKTVGLHMGAVLSYMGKRVLGQYDPFGGPEGTGRLLLVAPNVVAARRALAVSLEDFSLWVCLHEATHRLQFTSAPWLRDHFVELIAGFLTAAEASLSYPERMPAAWVRARGDGPSDGPSDGRGLLELLQSPEQRVAAERLLALLTLLEGHADYVMDAVGPGVVPSAKAIRARSIECGKGGTALNRLLRSLLGVQSKTRQYAVGSRFTEKVVNEVGMAAFNSVWVSPDALPDHTELADHRLWIARVNPHK